MHDSKKLAWGEYEPEVHRKSVEFARTKFLRAVNLHEPRVLETLYADVFGTYKESPFTFTTIRDLEFAVCMCAESNKEAKDLLTNLHSWAQGWHIDENWCLDGALQTMYRSHNEKSPSWHIVENYSSFGESATKEDERLLEFTHEGWEPSRQTRAQFKSEIIREFNLKLEEYLKKTEQLATQRGYVRTKSKHGDGHFDWLACFQVKEMDAADILSQFLPIEYDSAVNRGRDSLNNATKRIRSAINELADFIDLDLREEGIKPGRRSLK